jgi:uncharacterized protein YqkB
MDTETDRDREINTENEPLYVKKQKSRLIQIKLVRVLNPLNKLLRGIRPLLTYFHGV